MSIIAVDTGGTFTDVVCWRDDRLTVAKVPSTPADPALAVLRAVAQETRKVDTDGVARPFVLLHGSTVATNALLERRGARVALVTNAGFEDVLEIGRQNRPQLYALVGTRPPPIVPRQRRYGVAGRLDASGAELEPIDSAELEALAERVRGAESVAICLLHSYANPAHERSVAAALQGLGVPISVSSVLLPEFREFERTATTVVNAYVAPIMDRYLGRIEKESGAERVRIMGSGGGAIPVARARREPVHTVLSGPAGGVIGALEIAKRAGLDRILSFDMGGTSTDVSLCPGRPLHTRELVIAGLPTAIPVLDVHTVGAGGGSIARVDAGGALRVGPQSAGADPGPICYARGGREITVTDANVWLGRLPAASWSHALDGGRAAGLDFDAVREPLATLAAAMGTDPDTAAEGVVAVANAAMESALRVISVERGHDPADFTLVPFGGAAGLHAVALAERLGIPRILVPPDPGVLSAFGMVVAPVRKDASRTVLWDAAQAGLKADSAFAALETDALTAMADEGIQADAIVVHRTLDVRYRGQSFELTVPAGEGWVERFHLAHAGRYGYDRRDAVVEAVTLRIVALAAGSEIDVPTLPVADTPEPEADGIGTVGFDGARMEASHYRREKLATDHVLHGPCVVIEYSSTLWLPGGWQATVLKDGSLLARRGTG